MYKCFRCNCLFNKADEKWEEPNYVPAPFGFGEVAEGGGWISCCPECGCETYDEAKFDYENCPCCGEKIDFSTIKDEDNFEYVCKKCNYEIIVNKGDWVEE